MGHPRDPERRFARVTRLGVPSDFRPDLGPCLIYTGADNGNGYGQFRYDGRNGYAHRYAWERANGPIPEGLTIDHLCRVRRCVEITHLELTEGVENYLRGVEARNSCPNGHPYEEGSYRYAPKSRRCLICQRATSRRNDPKRTLKYRGLPDSRIKFDQQLVADAVALIRSGEKRISDAAREIGCHPNYLGRRTWIAAKWDAVQRDDGRCVRCGGDSTDVHHRTARGMGSTRDPSIAYGLANLVCLCRDCHIWAESRRADAFQEGLLVPRGTSPGSIAVNIFGRGRQYLDNEGGYRPELLS